MTSGQTLGGLVSIGASIGLDAIGAPPILQSFLPSALGGMLGGIVQNAGSGPDGGLTSEDVGNNIFSKIWNTAKRFGGGLIGAVGDVISLGADVLQRGYEAVRNTFGSLFSRQVQETLYEATTAGGTGLGAGWVLSSRTENYDTNDNLTSVVEVFTNTAGDRTTIVTGVQTGNYTIQREMANGNWFQEVYEGVSRGISGGFSVNNVAFAQDLGEGYQLSQDIGTGYHNAEITKNGVALLNLDGQNGGFLSSIDDLSDWTGSIDYGYGNLTVDQGAITNMHNGEMVWSNTYTNIEGQQETTIWIKAGENLGISGGNVHQEKIINGETQTFLQSVIDLGAKTMDLGNGVIGIAASHDLGQQVVDQMRDFIEAARDAGKYVLDKLAQIGAIAVDVATDAIDWVLEYTGADPRTATVERDGNIAEIDMDLNWQIPGEGFLQPGLDFVTSIFASPFGLLESAPANVRWMNSIRDAAPRIANQIKDPAVDFVFVPGVNSEGLSLAEKQALRDALHVEGKKTVFCHSAGTQACTEALKYLSPTELENVNFVFASPRVEFSQFDAAIRAAGLRQNQVAVVTSAFDLPHWTDLDSVDFRNSPSNILLDYGVGSIRDYAENPNASYRYMFLKDSDQLNKPSSLGHGSMFNGILNGWRYSIEVDGSLVTSDEKKGIEDILLEIFLTDEEQP